MVGPAQRSNRGRFLQVLSLLSETQRCMALPYSELIETQVLQISSSGTPQAANMTSTGQIRAGVFSHSMLDPLSQQTYMALNTTHMSGKDVTEKINNVGQDLINTIHVQFVSKKANMSYAELLTGLIYSGESIISQEPHIPYVNFNIEEEGKPTKVHSSGTAIITDRRLLMLSSQYAQTFSLRPLNDPKKLPGGYMMETSCADSTYYFPVPLHLLRGIEMESSTGVAGNQSVWGKPPVCCGLFTLCGLKKTWHPASLSYGESSQNVLRIGLLLPPWQNRATLTINMNTEVSLRHIRDMVSLLQTHAQNLL